MSYLCFDLDGVLCDFTRHCFIPAAERVLGRPMPPAEDSTYDLAEQLSLTRRESSAVWSSDALLDAMLAAPAIPEGLRLRTRMETAEGFAFITARGAEGTANAMRTRRITEHWVRHSIGIPDPELYFVEPSEKVIIARMLGATEMWEDHPETVLQLANAGIRTHMPLYGYNRHIAHLLVLPVPWNRNAASDAGAVAVA